MEEKKIENPYESVSMKVGDDAVPVCPNCFQPCNPLDNYCPNCISNEAINPLTPYLPFEGIRFGAGVYAKLWRKTWTSDTTMGRRLCYICIFLLFMPILFIIGLPFVVIEKLRPKQSASSQQESEC